MLKQTPLLQETPEQWSQFVVDHFENFILDHALCERKAASFAISFIVKCPEKTAIIEPMVSLAREELLHFQQVYRIINKKKYILTQ